MLAVVRGLSAAEREAGEQMRYRIVGSPPPPPSVRELRRMLHELTPKQREEVLQEWLEASGSDQRSED